MDWAKPQEGRPGEIWHVQGPDQGSIVLRDVAYPNGIGLSPDGKTAYIADYVGALVHHAEVTPSGLTAKGVLARLRKGNADGLAVDSSGRVWVATGSGGTFDCFDPDGELVDQIVPPATFAVTICFGGVDGRDVYLSTADNTLDPQLGGTIFKSRTDIPGLIPAVTRV
jgi:sugar lactone lactonase YvrE